VRDVALASRRELVEMTPKSQRGLNYSDVARIALERARTAREAIDIAVELIERYGDFTYCGNSHAFADPNEGWVLLTFAGGKGLWVARRLGPNDVWLNWRGNTGIGYVQTRCLRTGAKIRTISPRRTSCRSRSSRAGTNRIPAQRST
jgi:dipeptidase